MVFLVKFRQTISANSSTEEWWENNVLFWQLCMFVIWNCQCNKLFECLWYLLHHCGLLELYTYPVVRGEVGHGYCHLSSVFFPHFSLTAFSINSLQLLLFAVVLHSPPTLSRSLLTQSSHRILGLPRLFWPSDLNQFFISHSFYMTSPFQPTPH